MKTNLRRRGKKKIGERCGLWAATMKKKKQKKKGSIWKRKITIILSKKVNPNRTRH